MIKSRAITSAICIVAAQCCVAQEKWLSASNLLNDLKRIKPDDSRMVYLPAYKEDLLLITGQFADRTTSVAIEKEIDRLKRGGVKMGVVFDPFRISPMVNLQPLDEHLFQVDNFGAYEDRRSFRVANLSSSVYWVLVNARMKSVARALSTFDTIIIRTDSRVGRLMLYSPETREICVKKFGLDPIDFIDPLMENTHPNSRSAYFLPLEIKLFLLQDTIKRKGLLLSILKQNLATGKPAVAYLMDPPSLIGTLNERLGSSSVWLNEIEQAESGQLFFTLDDFDNLVGRFRNFLEALRSRLGSRFPRFKVKLVGTLAQLALLEPAFKESHSEFDLVVRPAKN